MFEISANPMRKAIVGVTCIGHALRKGRGGQSARGDPKWIPPLVPRSAGGGEITSLAFYQDKANASI